MFSIVQTPSYSHVYMVETEIMDEAQGRDGVFVEVVGRIDDAKPTDSSFDAFIESNQHDKLTVNVNLVRAIWISI